MKPKSTLRLAFPLATAIAALLAVSTTHAASLYWDIDDATAGAGGTAPSGSWTTGGITWSTSSNGTVATPAATTAATDDLFFSAGVNATGTFSVDLTDSQDLGSLTIQEGTVTIQGDGGVLNLGGSGGIIRVANGLTGTALTATIGNNTSSVIGGFVGLTKNGVGTLTLNGTAAHLFSGGIAINGGTLALNFENLVAPTDFVASGSSLELGGGTLSLAGKSTGTTSQTLGNVTVNAGGGQLLGNRNGGTALDITLGSLNTIADGGSLLVGTTVGGSAPTITSITDKDPQGIYGGRVVFSNGSAGSGYEWATTASVSAPYPLSAYGGYTALDLTAGTDTANSRITAGATLTGNRTTNSLKFENPANAQILDLGGNTLTLTSGGLLITGPDNTQAPRITNGFITAGVGSNYDLVVHQFNLANKTAGSSNNNPIISANISDNGANPVTLVKAGTGTLLLTGANSFTGGIVVNGGIFGWSTSDSVNFLNNNSLTFNANSTVLANGTHTTNGGITINNGSQIDIRNNTKTFTVNGPVTGAGGGITLGQNGGGATNLVFNNTNNSFTGPVRFAVTAQSGNLTVNSFVDSSTVGEGNITFGLSNATVAHNFNYGTNAVAALTLNNRRFELTGTGNNQTASINNNSSQALSINTDVVSTVTGTTAKNFTLGGAGSGLSTLAGAIPSPGGTATINVVKNGSGTWVLGGANTYNGLTTVSAGTLRLTNTLAAQNSSGVTIAGNTLQFGSDSTSWTIPKVTAQAGTIVSDRATVGDGLTHVLGDGRIGNGLTNFTAGANVNNTGTAAIQYANIDNDNGSTANPGFNPTTANVIITGNVTLGGGSNGGTANLTLGGTGSVNSIGGNILLGARVTGNLIKSGTSIWTLSGAGSNYNGTTTINGGTLALGASASITSSASVTLGAAGTLDTSAQMTYAIPAAQPLAFGIDATGSGSSGKIVAAGLDITSAAVTYNITGTPDDPVYVLATYSGTLTGAAFASVPAAPTGYTLDYAYEGNKIALVASAGPTYATWIAGFGVTGLDALATADPDFDGICNSAEMVLGGNPATGMDTALLPTIELVNADPDGDTTFADYLLFTYRRSDLSGSAGVTTDCETDTDLVAPWTAATGAPGVVILVDDNFTFTPPAAANTDRVRVYVPRGANTTLFGRLRVVVP